MINNEEESSETGLGQEELIQGQRMLDAQSKRNQDYSIISLFLKGRIQYEYYFINDETLKYTIKQLYISKFYY